MESSVAQVTAKGQVTIPRSIREALQIEQGDQLVFRQEGERVLLIPLRRRPLSELLGALPASRPDPGIDRVRRTVRQEIGRRMQEGEE
jgi:antitoxin PrlF